MLDLNLRSDNGPHLRAAEGVEAPDAYGATSFDRPFAPRAGARRASARTGLRMWLVDCPAVEV